jgi:chitodextrinase
VDGGVTPLVTTGGTRTWRKTYDYANYSFGTTSETLTLTVTDAAGNTSTETVSVTVTKSDDEQPSISSFTVSSDAVNITTSNQVQTITFTAVASDNVSVASINVPGATYVNVVGSTYTWTKDFSYADYSFGSTPETYTVTATDAAGNTKDSSVSLTVTKIDD